MSEPRIHTDYADYTDFSVCVTVVGAFIPQRRLIRQTIREISVIRVNQRF
ncbi:hypothetical protein QUF75_05240 [Desulfococcaceae bacterium HSG7]|nr:hypothetical protein [Desulfococcaceae bacterium HSG7]